MEFLKQERAAYYNALNLIDLALAEDLLPAMDDLTSRLTIPEGASGSARFVARSAGVLAGEPVLRLLSERFRLKVGPEPTLRDGDRLEPGSLIDRVEGPMRQLLAMERTALNFLQRLSGVATLTARFVAEVAGTKAVILDTRKTTPGWRALEKYAVRCGGGTNHRIGLYDAVLIKDNHLGWLAASRDPIGRAVTLARAGAPDGRSSSRSRSTPWSSWIGPWKSAPTSSWWTTSAPRSWPRRSAGATRGRPGSCWKPRAG
jgi:nicotinate-nucleotide pyrophosphorylase (carboxylating)